MELLRGSFLFDVRMPPGIRWLDAKKKSAISKEPEEFLGNILEFNIHVYMIFCVFV
jgi:hypothetical protein